MYYSVGQMCNRDGVQKEEEGRRNKREGQREIEIAQNMYIKNICIERELRDTIYEVEGDKQ